MLHPNFEQFERSDFEMMFSVLQAPAFNAWGENYCEDLRGSPSFDNLATSLRFAGAPDGYKYDTISLYEYNFYMGIEQYAYGDAPTLNYDNLGR